MRKLIIGVLILSSLFTTPNYEALASEQHNETPDRVYSIIVDRFSNGDSQNDMHISNDEDDHLPYGGDYVGIIDKLDYINDMGFNAIQLSNVFDHEDTDYLGYKEVDYGTLEPMFGTEDEFKQLIKAAHDRDMKVIIDIPMTANNQYSGQSIELDGFVADYYGDTEFIDFTKEQNKKQYKSMLNEFVEQYNVDGLSMYTHQSVDANEILPSNVTTYAFETVGKSTNFDHVQQPHKTKTLQQSFKTINQPIESYSNDKHEILAADTWFTERFTHFAASENMFPPQRIKQLSDYMMMHNGPVFFNYGTEIALNGEELPTIHRLMNFRTDAEIIDHITHFMTTLKDHQVVYRSDKQLIKKGEGYLLSSIKTDDVPFVYYINNTDKTLDQRITSVSQDKMLRGLLIGDNVYPKEEEHELILNREESELYATIDVQPMNWGYLIAAFIIFIGFGIFVFILTKRSKKNQGNH